MLYAKAISRRFDASRQTIWLFLSCCRYPVCPSHACRTVFFLFIELRNLVVWPTGTGRYGPENVASVAVSVVFGSFSISIRLNLASLGLFTCLPLLGPFASVCGS